MYISDLRASLGTPFGAVCTRPICVFPFDLLTMTKKSKHWISPSSTIPLQFLLAKWESLNDVSWYLSILWLIWHIYSLSTTYGHTIAMSAKLSAADRRDMNLHTYKDRHSAFMKMVERQKELEEEQQKITGNNNKVSSVMSNTTSYLQCLLRKGSPYEYILSVNSFTESKNLSRVLWFLWNCAWLAGNAPLIQLQAFVTGRQWLEFVQMQV